VEWSRLNDFIPILGAGLGVVLALASLRDRSPNYRRNSLVSVLVVSALSIALYWSDGLFSSESAPLLAVPFLSRLGLWAFKVAGAIAAIGLVAESRGLRQYVAPTFLTLTALFAAGGILVLVGAVS